MYTIALLGHELKKRQLPIVLTLLAIGALFLYSFSLLNKVADQAQVLILPVLALAFPLILWTLWNHWQSLREEWQERTTHLLFSFPVRGWQVLLAKGGAAAISFALFTLLSAVLGGALVMKVFSSIPGEISQEELWHFLFSDGSKLYLQYLLITLSFIGFSQLAFVLGQLAPRWHGIFSTGGFLVILYLVGKLMIWLRPVFSILPHVNLEFGSGGFNPWYTVALFLFSLIAAGTASWLLDHKVDF